MNKKARKAFVSLELMLTMAVVLILAALAGAQALEKHKENALEKVYADTTQILSHIVATDNVNTYVGFLRSGENCLDGNMYDAGSTKVNAEKLKLCLGDDLGAYKNYIYDTGANSYYLHSVLPCSLKLSGSITNNSDFVFTLDCSQIDDVEYRTSVITRMSDYVQSRDIWMNLHVSNLIDADKKILTVNMRL